MGLPTTATGPTNVYYLVDDSTNSTGGAGGGASNQPLSPQFTATTATDAAVMAQHFATLFNRPVRLVTAYGGTPPWTPLYTPSTCRVLPSAVPQSILY
jgi:hypothetical protein